jgi:hypothetical protein
MDYFTSAHRRWDASGEKECCDNKIKREKILMVTTVHVASRSLKAA